MADGNTSAGKHEIKFGFRGAGRRWIHRSSGPATRSVSVLGRLPRHAAPASTAGATDAEGRRTRIPMSATRCRRTAYAQCRRRYDRQVVGPPGALPGGQPRLPTLLAAHHGPAVQNVIGLEDSVTPRVGLTYALDESRKTQLRAPATACSRRSSATRHARVHLSVAHIAYMYFYAVDKNGNKGSSIRRESPQTSQLGNWTASTSTNPSDAARSTRSASYNDAEDARSACSASTTSCGRTSASAARSRTGTLRTSTGGRYIGVTGADYPQIGTLTGTCRRSVERRHLQRYRYYAMTPSARPAPAGPRLHEAQRLPPAIRGSRSPRPSDCRTGGWRASGSPPTTTEYFTAAAVIDRPDAQLEQPEQDGG